MQFRSSGPGRMPSPAQQKSTRPAHAGRTGARYDPRENGAGYDTSRYPFPVFSWISLSACFAAAAPSGNDLTDICPADPMRPYRTVTSAPLTATAQNFCAPPSDSSYRRPPAAAPLLSSYGSPMISSSSFLVASLSQSGFTLIDPTEVFPNTRSYWRLTLPASA